MIPSDRAEFVEQQSGPRHSDSTKQRSCEDRTDEKKEIIRDTH